MKTLLTIWKFSRPHTIIGSVISIITLYFIVCDKKEVQYLSFLVPALIIGITCNIFIVGINQIADIQLDKINKPNLPLPSGALSPAQAWLIVSIALSISLGLALFITPYLFGIIAFAAAIGWAYSMPPFYLKKHHLTAALSISIVRGLLLNAGGFMVFNYLVNDTLVMPENVKILTVFIMVFSIAISWFKDLPDMEGDAKYNIQTLALLYSPKMVLISGHLLVGMAYLFTIYMKYAEYAVSATPSHQTTILLSGHWLLLGLFIFNAVSIKSTRHFSFKTFYKRFWWFFFAEYLLYLLSYAVK